MSITASINCNLAPGVSPVILAACSGSTQAVYENALDNACGRTVIFTGSPNTYWTVSPFIQFGADVWARQAHISFDTSIIPATANIKKVSFRTGVQGSSPPGISVCIVGTTPNPTVETSDYVPWSVFGSKLLLAKLSAAQSGSTVVRSADFPKAGFSAINKGGLTTFLAISNTEYYRLWPINAANSLNVSIASSTWRPVIHIVYDESTPAIFGDF